MSLAPSASRAPALNESLAETLSRWQSEAQALAKQGVYDWLCTRIEARRVLEIGCGFGASTAALVKAGKTVFALDNRMDCLEAAKVLSPEVTYGLADVHQTHDLLIQDLKEFAPEAVVCWLGGAPADALPQEVPAQYRVMQHRLALQHAVIQLAQQLPSVRTIHLADRTAFPWKMKDTAKQTLCQILSGPVIEKSSFAVRVDDIQFRRLTDVVAAPASGVAAGLVAVMGEATLRRTPM